TAEPVVTGNLALDRADVWLYDPPAFDTVAPDMPSSRPTRRRRVERRQVRAARRSRRFALLIVLTTLLVIALALSAVGGTSSRAPKSSPANAPFSRQTKPFPQIVAMRGVVRLQMPIVQSQYTAIGYHSSADNAIRLSPVGHQGNEGALQRMF